ncbi:MAG: sugar ABC transporter permease [Roseburia sp.]|jgi:lactose/L-arabinose transport system permease protein|nr:sugar ABC transporter permease [Roseburia sp.]
MSKKGKRRFQLTGWSMVVVAAAFVLFFSYVPMVQAFFLSLKTGKGANLEFSGLANYARMFQDKVFWTTLGNTLLYAVIQIPVMIFLALLIAVLLNDPGLKLRGIYRTCIFLPCVTSLVSYSILFKNLFAVDGLVNQLLLKLGLIDTAIPFVLTDGWAKAVVVIALLWRHTGYFMIFFLSALQNIDQSVFEAAKLDGSNFFQTFFRITMPMMRPIVFLTSVMALNNTLQLFDEVVNLTNGGPGNATRTISQYIYDLSFTYVPSYGYAAAVSYVVLLLIVLITIVQKKVIREK